MSSVVPTGDSAAVQAEVTRIFTALFPGAKPKMVKRAFGWAIDAFEGRYKDYLPIDTVYHDFEHTLQGTLCFARMLEGYARAGAKPTLTQEMFELGLIAILLHDTGYLKTSDDREGTGAKYTLIHVHRSAEFAGVLLSENGFAPDQVRAVQHMIRCTGVNVKLESIPFQSELEQRLGFALGSADLIGQMAAPDYVEKLPILYSEFVESAAHNGGEMTTAGSFASAEDLVSRTPIFWEKYVMPKLFRDFQGVCEYLKSAEGSGASEYRVKIERNIERVRKNAAERRITPVG